MQFKNLATRLTAILTLTTLGVLGMSAQTTYRLPGQHTQQQEQLLAHQGSMTNSIAVPINIDYLNFTTEDEPELDIYTEGWNSGRVNCYNLANVPQKATIDVSRYHMPHPGPVSSPYGWRPRFGRMHKGVDISLHVGDTVRAAFDGRVRITNYEARGYGNYVVVRHTNDLETVYGHLSKFLVKNGDYVKAGTPIALGGNTGRSTGPHLHFETRYMGYAINPAGIFDFANQTTHTDTYTFTTSTYQNARNFSPEANAQYAQKYYKSRAVSGKTHTARTSKARSQKSTKPKTNSTSKRKKKR